MRRILALGIIILTGCATPRGLGARASVALGDASQAQASREGSALSGAGLVARTYRVAVLDDERPGPAGLKVEAWDSAAADWRSGTTDATGVAVLVLEGPLTRLLVDSESVTGAVQPDRGTVGLYHVVVRR